MRTAHLEPVRISVSVPTTGFCSRGRGGVRGGYHVTYLMMHLILPTPSPPNGQTDACKNITFPQLRLRAGGN